MSRGLDIVKYKLYEEQNGICPYSGKNIDSRRLFEAGYVDIDHIVPYSISFDDSYNNKVLVLAGENRQKGNRIPYAYFGHDAARWARFETLVNTQFRSYKKRKNLLMRSLSEAQLKDFKQRNLVDTQYMATVMKRLIENHLTFAETAPEKRPVQTVNGAITAQVRKRLGIIKDREDGDLHHAADAAVIACITPTLIRRITKHSQFAERVVDAHGHYVDFETGRVLTREEFDAVYLPEFPEPWKGFRNELEARLSENPAERIARLNPLNYLRDEKIPAVFVSRMPRHKVTGAAHAETIRSKKGGEGTTVTKTKLTALKLDKKTGEIKGYYRPEDDPLLYNALKARLTAFGGKGETAFAEPFYKPKHNGEPGNEVRTVKIIEPATLTVPVNHGVAANGGMVRVDVFLVKGDGYYFVPVYTADTVKKELPNLAAVAFKAHKDWKPMKEEDFVFSLYAGDLIRIQSKKGIKLNACNKNARTAEIVMKDSLFYFAGFSINTASLNIQTHDRRYQQPSLGGKTLPHIEKYEVDVLGDVHPVRLPEKRMPFR